MRAALPLNVVPEAAPEPALLNVMALLVLMLMSTVPSNATLLMFRAVANLVAEPAFPLIAPLILEPAKDASHEGSEYEPVVITPFVTVAAFPEILMPYVVARSAHVEPLYFSHLAAPPLKRTAFVGTLVGVVCDVFSIIAISSKRASNSLTKLAYVLVVSGLEKSATLVPFYGIADVARYPRTAAVEQEDFEAQRVVCVRKVVDGVQWSCSLSGNSDGFYVNEAFCSSS